MSSATRACPRGPRGAGVALALAAATAAPAAAAEPPRLRYAEPLAAHWEAAATGGEGRGRLRFRAHGRGFDLTLRPHPQLSRPGTDYALQAGEMSATPGSWARLMRRGEDLIGIVSDGRELYGIEPAADVAEYLDPDVPRPPGHNVVFRLADLMIDPATLACGAGRAAGRPVSAAAAVAELTAELGTAAATAAATTGTVRRIALAPVADVEFATYYGASAESEVMARLNIADGIFREQVGIDLAPAAPEIVTTTAPPYEFTATDAEALLDQFSDYRASNHRQFGMSHLFTRKSLDNRLAGIAWQSAACRTREGAALSTSFGLSATLSALVATHEIGHQFGAPHDGESGSACFAEPATFLMAPRVPNNPTFSPCSLGQMGTVIDSLVRSYPACLTAVANYDVTVVAPVTVQGEPGTPTSVTLSVRNLGLEPASALGLRVTMPTALAATSVAPDRGSCTTLADGVSCTLDSLAAEASWQVGFSVQSDQTRSYTLTARASAAADEQAGNNSAQFSVTIGGAGQAATGGGGGGGGTLGWTALVALALGAPLRRGARRMARGGRG